MSLNSFALVEPFTNHKSSSATPLQNTYVIIIIKIAIIAIINDNSNNNNDNNNNNNNHNNNSNNNNNNNIQNNNNNNNNDNNKEKGVDIGKQKQFELVICLKQAEDQIFHLERKYEAKCIEFEEKLR